MLTTKPKFAKKSLILAASFVLLAATLPTTGAASEGPAVIATISLGPNADATAFALAVNPNTNKLYVTMTGGCCTDGNAVAVIDGSTDTVLGYIDVDLNPFMVAVDSRTNLVYVTHGGQDKITVIDGSTDTVKATFSIGSEAREI